jgi:hypothetical protein
MLTFNAALRTRSLALSISARDFAMSATTVPVVNAVEQSCGPTGVAVRLTVLVKVLSKRLS